MNEEIMKILKMVEEKKLTADEASKLINAINVKKSESEWIDLNQPTADDKGEETSETTPGKKPSWLFIMVQKGDKKNIKVRIPIKLARWALRFIPKQAQTHMKEQLGEDFDLNELAQLLDHLPAGEDLVNVYDEDENESVRIFLR